MIYIYHASTFCYEIVKNMPFILIDKGKDIRQLTRIFGFSFEKNISFERFCDFIVIFNSSFRIENLQVCILCK